MTMATVKKHGYGDDGFTSLPEGARVPKTHPRIRFFAALDELNCRLGLARACSSDRGRAALLLRLQRALPCLAAENKTPEKARAELRFLETKTAALEKKLPPLKNFLTPGHSPEEAALHCARSACRMAELQAWGMAGCRQAAVYLNRLSSCLFALARVPSNK